MLQPIQKIFDGVSDVCFGLSFATLAFITLLVCTDVFLRLFFDKSIPWTTEISEALILYMTFLGTEKVLRENNHVKVDILTSRVSEKVKRIFNIMSACIGLAVTLFFLIFGSMTAWSFYNAGSIILRPQSCPWRRSSPSSHLADCCLPTNLFEKSSSI